MNEEQGKFLEELYHANFKRMLLELYPICLLYTSDAADE